MSHIAQKILVVGGNGFVGSAVCKMALARGIEVTSISFSGKPYKTPQGHTPAWVERVEWRKADAMNPESYADILPGVDAVVHTVGTLLDNTQYKQKMQEGDVLGVFKSLMGRKEEGQRSAYDTLNYESAVCMCEAFVASKPASGITRVRPFVYVSAEDVNRPVVSVRYLETKREAEKRIEEIMQDHPQYKGVYVRPSLIYHPHIRPMTTIPATIFDVSARIHNAVPSYIPMPSSVLRWLGTSVFPNATEKTPSALTSMANLLSIPPIHVDHLAEAICLSLDPAQDIRGVVGVRDIRRLIGMTASEEPTTNT
ncbi:mitochondrial protein [Suillus clintonianus]|uniref:mitochondrial protein n=1 Tax=Suillus clintonianus TaxID=1904413 RepID=UPI001B87419E|nr:mitochondrial protein [Suillus clintonianus]KAG2157176.1 mitochondrial protein [Suillus clintonianus]